MFFDEISWIRSYRHKLCPALKKQVLECYRPSKYVPCYMQKPLKQVKERWRKMPVIVQTYASNERSCDINKIAASAKCTIKKELPVINAFSTKIDAKKLESLVQNKDVKKVWFDREIRAVLDMASPTVHSPTLWNSNITGKGVVVAVLDTGIHDHPDLSGRVIAFKDFIKQKNELYDDNGHGTHVAGDIASNGSQSNYRYKGPAPEAKLVGIKVLNKMGSGSDSTVIEAIQWCIDNKETMGIKIINMSLGGEATQSYTEDPVCQAVERAWKSGIIVCVAAGNSGPEPRTIDSPGIHPMVITVGALDDINTSSPADNQVADFSSRGPTVDNLVKPDMLAPGANIVSLRSPRSMLDKQNKKSRVDEWYCSFSGTSMATPICSGVVAQMLQRDSSLKPDQVKKRLIASAKPLPDLDKNVQGAGVIDAQKSVNGSIRSQTKSQIN